MARTQRADSNVIFAPTVLRLKSAAHRASLDGNDVAVLSGRDPKEYGSIGRMPGGRRVSTNFPSESFAATKAWHFQRRGLVGGHIVNTTGTAASIGAASTTVTVGSPVGFELGDWVVLFKASTNAIIGRISAIGASTITMDYGTAPGDTTAISDGTLMVCTPDGGVALNAGATTANQNFADSLLRRGQTYCIGHGIGANAVETVETRDITVVAGATPLHQVSFSPALAANKGTLWCFVPKIELLDLKETMVWQSGATSGNILNLQAGTYKSMGLVNTSGMAMVDRWIFSVNGFQPTRFNMASGAFDPTASTIPPYSFMGFKSTAFSTIGSAVAGGSVSVGSHKFFLRMVDRSVYPEAKSPPAAQQTLSFTAGTQTLRLDIEAVVLKMMQAHWHRGTHIQIWMTTAGGGTYFLAADHKLSYYLLDTAAAWDTTFDLSISDQDLALNESLDPADYEKGPPPNGTYIHHSQGLTLIAGVTPTAAPDRGWPPVLSANTLYFSRTDVDEPENFPARNFKQIGKLGDKIWGFVDAGDTTLILSRFSFTVLQRAGSVLLFREGDVGKGLAYEEAYQSVGPFAVWVSDQSIYMFDGRTQDSPEDIGLPIRDWILGLRSISGVQVRVGYDPINRLVWVGKSSGTTIGECKIYSLDDKCWVTREDCILNAPFAGEAVESSSSPFAFYRFSGSPPNCWQAIDYENEPIVDGGFSPSSYTLSGTLAGAGGITTITGLTLPATNSLRGLFVRFLKSDGTETLRRIESSTATAISWTTSYTGAVGDTWIIGGVPFRVRLPPIRGDDPFAVKKALGAMVMLDNVDYNGQSDGSASLTIKLLRNYSSSPATGATDTFTISQAASLVDRQRACNVQTSGKVVEVQLDQLMNHVDFSVLYTGLFVVIPGSLIEDQSATV